MSPQNYLAIQFGLWSRTAARPLRIEYDGALYHVTSRGNNRKTIFKDDSDRTLFLNIRAQVKNRGEYVGIRKVIGFFGGYRL
ncbi:MAG TPA: hypothetical protein VLJ79_13545 [Candidatus Binatia bacterium]|nr:hypothetical protein [Candidatus Binatia bacterium]